MHSKSSPNRVKNLDSCIHPNLQKERLSPKVSLWRKRGQPEFPSVSKVPGEDNRKCPPKPLEASTLWPEECSEPHRAWSQLPKQLFLKMYEVEEWGAFSPLSYRRTWLLWTKTHKGDSRWGSNTPPAATLGTPFRAIRHSIAFPGPLD